ncbi:hypothetical protein DSO57_1012088 [Entomophthora muscae]|uniref:Uncharacterized protein n=1 Tax=Entomophthora muscae TaxID=34485 RepID=A0ACC2TTM6_9FUNG|nr:hypothetical protein DSO57_1012088 [Entomophthora muscae]
MGAQKENYSNGYDFAGMRDTNSYDTEESDTASEIEATNQIDASTFVPPLDLLDQYPAENPAIALYFAFNPPTTLSPQENTSQGEAFNTAYQRSNSVFETLPQPSQATLDFGRQLLPYFMRHIGSAQEVEQGNLTQIHVSSSMNLASASVEDSDSSGLSDFE